MIAALLCALSLFEFSLAPEVNVRRVTFHDRLTPSLAGYKSGALGLLRVSALVYPAAGRELPFISDVGFYGSYARSLKSRTLTADGTLAFDAQETWWDTGARYRVVLDGEEWAAVSFGYGSLRNDFSGPQLPGILLPAGMLQYWRPGISGRLPLGGIVLGADLGYLLLVRQDAVGQAFPRSSSAGLDLGLRAELLLRQFSVKLALRYMRFFYSLHPLPYDPYIAGGALDELFAVNLAFGLRL